MMAIYDKLGISGKHFFIMYDPKRNEQGKSIFEDDHRAILRHILKTITPESKLQGTITLPRIDYNR
jgi:hypothetical protein